jgi:hypothetical protein
MKPDSRLRITTSRRQTAFQIPSPSSKPNCVGRADRTHKRACGGISVTTLGKSVLAPLRINLLPVSVYRPTHFLCFDPTPPEWGRSQSLRQVGQCNAVRVMTAMRPPWMPATTLETDIQRQRPWYSLWARFGYRWERLISFCGMMSATKMRVKPATESNITFSPNALRSCSEGVWGKSSSTYLKSSGRSEPANHWPV